MKKCCNPCETDSVAGAIKQLQRDMENCCSSALEGVNLGGGDIIFKQKLNNELQFKTIVAGDNITLTPTPTELIISASGGGGEDVCFSNTGNVTFTQLEDDCWEANASGGSTMRFGFPTEDDVAGENRIFDANQFQVNIDNTSSARLQAISSGDASYVQVGINFADIYSEANSGSDFAEIFVDGDDGIYIFHNSNFDNNNPSKFLTTDNAGKLMLSPTPAHLQGGNTYGADGVLGSIDNRPLRIHTTNNVRWIFNKDYSRIDSQDLGGLYINGGTLGNSTLGSANVIIGVTGGGAGENLTTAARNVGIGYRALRDAVTVTDTVAIGDFAAAFLTGGGSVFMGSSAGTISSGGFFNTAVGYNAMGGVGRGGTLTSGEKNAALGDFALAAITGTSTGNIGIGHAAGFGLASGNDNIMIGSDVMFNSVGNITASSNVMIGNGAGAFMTGGNRNTRLGGATPGQTPAITSTDSDNVLIGYGAYGEAGGGTKNIAVGTLCGAPGFVSGARSRGDGNISIGYATGSLSNATNSAILIGTRISPVDANGSGQLNIGNTIYGTNFYVNNTTNSSTPTTTGSIAIGNQTPTARLDLPASTAATNTASLRIRAGVAPTTPNDGDIWQDGSNIFIRLGGVTKQFTLV